MTKLAQLVHFAIEGKLSCSGFAIKVERTSKLHDFGVEFFKGGRGGFLQPKIVDQNGVDKRGAVTVGPGLTELEDKFGNTIFMYRVIIADVSLVEGETLILKLCYDTEDLENFREENDKIYAMKSVFSRLERKENGQVTPEGVIEMFE